MSRLLGRVEEWLTACPVHDLCGGFPSRASCVVRHPDALPVPSIFGHAVSPALPPYRRRHRSATAQVPRLYVRVAVFGIAAPESFFVDPFQSTQTVLHNRALGPAITAARPEESLEPVRANSLLAQ